MNLDKLLEVTAADREFFDARIHRKRPRMAKTGLRMGQTSGGVSPIRGEL
jgi:hypothetical protein